MALGAAFLAALTTVTYVPAETTEPPKQNAVPAPQERAERSTSLLFGFGLGVEFARPSAEADLLELDGYSLGPRAKAFATLAGFPSDFVGIGGYFELTAREATPSSTAPTLTESAVHTGLVLPFLLKPSPRWLFTLGPRLGAVSGSLSVNKRDDLIRCAEYGAATSAFYRVGGGGRSRGWFLGVSIAYTFAPTARVGGVGREHDFGGLTLALAGAFDD